MGKGSAPSAPDPYASAAAQYQYGTQAAGFNKALNDTTTSNPLSSTSYAYQGSDPITGAPQWSQSTQLSPAEQAILQQSQSEQIGAGGLAPTVEGQAANAIGAGMPNLPPPVYQPSGYNPLQASTGYTPQGMNSDAFKTALSGEEAAINPGLTQEREQLDASLRNSGAHPGDAAYDNAMSALDARQGGVQTQAAGAAINAGTGVEAQQYQETLQNMVAANQAAGQSYDEALKNAQQQMQSRGQAISQTGQIQGIPISELQAIEGLQQPYGGGANASPGQASTGTPDIMSAFQNQYQGQLNQYNANVGSQNAAMGDAASLAAAYMIATSSF